MTSHSCEARCTIALAALLLLATPGCRSSDDGVSTAGDPSASRDWPQWRGPARDGTSPYVPEHLPREPRFLWQQDLTGHGLAGLVVAGGRLIVADKSSDDANDVWRCLDADTGRQLWTLEYPAAGDMDYSNAPRAAPLVHDGLVYTLGAFGLLHCVRLADGHVVWKRDLIDEFHAELVNWGMSASPLIVDGKLIVNPGAPDAAVVALDPRTGATIWATPGQPAGYASFIVGTFGGRRQIVGCDATSAGGWDVATGQRLWKLVPEQPGDFNVPTPIDLCDGWLLLATENNGTRIYAFDADGAIRPEPVLRSRDLAPDSSTPVVAGGRVFGVGYAFTCLDLTDLKTLWHVSGSQFDYASLIAGNGRVLVATVGGELLLLPDRASGLDDAERLKPFGDAAETWAHPALTPGRLYLRSSSKVSCLLLD